MKRKDSIKNDVWFLLIKIGFLAVLLIITFSFIFGISRCSDNSMNPSLKEGDLAFYYRLQKEYNGILKSHLVSYLHEIPLIQYPIPRWS